MTSGVVGNYFNHKSLAIPSLPKRHRIAAMASCRALIDTLAD
ncbi:MAG: hypothetical protein P1V35_09275 [Planctomycetota bacterium]|nr:hypothetical protein [Planctomycetota bacterium]